MSATSVSMELTSFILQICFNYQNSKILTMGKVVEEYLKTKSHIFLFLMYLLFNKKFALATKYIW